MRYTKALQDAGGNKAAAARLLGITRASFREGYDAEQSRKIRIDVRGEKADGPAQDADLRDALAGLLRKRKTLATVEQLADTLDVAPARVRNAMEGLRRGGHNITIISGGVGLTPDIPKTEPTRIDIRKLGGKTFKFGLTADNHLCFPGSTRVETERGPRRIDQIKVGERVLTHRGAYQKVTRIFRTPHDGWFTRIRFRGASNGGSDAYASLVVTDNHPVLVSRAGRDVFVRACDIVEGDYVRQMSGKCARCDARIPVGLRVCKEHDPFVRQISDGAKKQRYETLCKAAPSRHFNEDIVPVMSEWQEGGWRVVPVDRVRPDFIAIKDGRVVAVEVEAPKMMARGSYTRPRPIKEKYVWADHAKYYDAIEWVEIDRRTRRRNTQCDWIGPNGAGFIGFRVSRVERFKSRPLPVYNLAVAGDESYVAKRCVVHNCSLYARDDVLNALFDIWEAEGIKTVYQCGNMIDGEARFNRSDLLVHGMEGQAKFFAKHWPKRKGMTTYYVTGDDHEGWYTQRECLDIGRYLADMAQREGRTDLVYLGHMEHDIEFSGRKQTSIMRLLHAGGGSAYAISYAPQKIVESYGPREKPHVLLIGHYHKAEYLYTRAVHVVQAGTTMDQSPFMRKNKLQAHVGGWIVEMTVNDDGVITRFKTEWLPFFDREFYAKGWAYKRAA